MLFSVQSIAASHRSYFTPPRLLALWNPYGWIVLPPTGLPATLRMCTHTTTSQWRSASHSRRTFSGAISKRAHVQRGRFSQTEKGHTHTHTHSFTHSFTHSLTLTLTLTLLHSLTDSFTHSLALSRFCCVGRNYIAVAKGYQPFISPDLTDHITGVYAKIREDQEEVWTRVQKRGLPPPPLFFFNREKG